MVIERLLFQVNPAWVEDFITVDNQVWLPWLQRQPGFLRKTHQTRPGGLVETLIYWKDQAAWDRAGASLELPSVELLFRNRIGPVYRLVSSS